MDARCGMEKSAESLWTRLFAGIPTYSPVSVTITRHTRLDEESMHRSEPTAEELARRCTKPADWMEDRCFVCSQKVEFLHGVYQTTGCTKHFGAAVTGALGLNKNTLNLVHLGDCYASYVLILKEGKSNCLLCRGDAMHKPPAEHTADLVVAGAALLTAAHHVSFYDPSGGWPAVHPAPSHDHGTHDHGGTHDYGGHADYDAGI